VNNELGTIWRERPWTILIQCPCNYLGNGENNEKPFVSGLRSENRTWFLLNTEVGTVITLPNFVYKCVACNFLFSAQNMVCTFVTYKEVQMFVESGKSYENT
jgi:hypothetical protein